MNKDFYTVKDIAEELQVTEKAARGLINAGKLPASKILNKWIVTAENLAKFIAENEVKEPGDDIEAL